ncbi:MAG: lysophospholipid acyltransferase family protein [Planctomycetota bacterium]|jgi:1-acyl-sn-glycerol-3-phosphate acyltransferase
MSTRRPVEPPSAEEIERLFHHPTVTATRPVLLTGIEILKRVRRFNWRGEGIERLEALDAPFVFAANHVSHADTPAILGTLPRAIRARTVVAAALDVFGADHESPRPRLKRMLPLVVAAGFHAFAFDRQGPPMRSVRTSVQLIRNGWNLLLYPEGTRSRTGRIASFKPGVGVLARFTGRPIVPVNVQGGDDVLACGTFLPRPGRMLVRFGDPLQFGAGDTAASFAARLEDAVRDLGLQSPQGAGAAAASDARRAAPEPTVSNQPA